MHKHACLLLSLIGKYCVYDLCIFLMYEWKVYMCYMYKHVCLLVYVIGKYCVYDLCIFMGPWSSGLHICHSLLRSGFESQPGQFNFKLLSSTLKVPLGSNRWVICLLDVLNVLYCHQPVSCALVTCHAAWLKVEVCARTRAHVNVYGNPSIGSGLGSGNFQI